MAKLGKLFVDLALAAGIAIDDDKLKDITTSDMEVPDDIAASLKSNLMTEEAAKNNASLKRHFTAQALNTVDAELSDFIKSYTDFTDADKSAFEAEKSTYKRIPLLMKRVQEIEGKKASTDPADPTAAKKLEAMKAELDKVNAQVLEVKNSHQTELASAKAQAEKDLLDFAIKSELLGKEYANKDLDKPTNVLIARQILDAKLAEAKVKVVKGENGSPRLVQIDNPEMDYMVDNKKVEFGSFTDSVLGEKKLLHVATPGAPGNPGNPGGTGRHIDPPAGGNPPNNDALLAQYDAEIARMGVTA